MPTQQQLKQATALRAKGYTPKAAAEYQTALAKQLYAFGSGAPEAVAKAIGFSGNIHTTTTPESVAAEKAAQADREANTVFFQGQHDSGPGEYVYTGNARASSSGSPQHDNYVEGSNENPSIGGDFLKALSKFNLQLSPEGRNKQVTVYDRTSGKAVAAQRVWEPEGLDMQLAGVAIPAFVGMGFGGGLAALGGFTGAGAGAVTGATSGAVSSLAAGGSFANILKSAALGGLGGGATAGLTGAGVNPIAARAITGLGRAVITGGDPRTALLQAAVGGMTGGNKAASLLAQILIGMKKRGKP